MSIHRAGSYPCSFTPPKPPAEYEAIEITFAQNEQVVITKRLGDPGVEINGADLEVTLTQQETALFMPSVCSPMGRAQGSPVSVQIRCFASDYDAPASACWAVQVYDSNTEGALS